MMMKLKVLGWYMVGHIMKRQNGKEEGVATSWEDELPRYTPHTRKWKWRWRYYLLVMAAIS